MSFIAKALMRLAIQVVESVVSQATQQLSIVEDQALSPLKTVVQQVEGGVWKGEGANKFIDEVSSISIPGVGQVGDQIRSFQGNLTRARDIIMQADKQAHQVVGNLADTFGSIF
jgi:hypothetical protein